MTDSTQQAVPADVVISTSERIAASIWAGIFPKKATDEQVEEWRQSLVRPFAFRDQACCISKTGSTVTIECDDADYANDLFDWLSELPSEVALASLSDTPILRGVGKINGDGWKDTTRKGETVFVWNTELPEPYAKGQFPRIGYTNWTAGTDQYDFTPATSNDVPAIFSALHTHNRDSVIEECAREELKAATGTLAEAIKDLRARGFHDAVEVLERKTMPETVKIFEANLRALTGEKSV